MTGGGGGTIHVDQGPFVTRVTYNGVYIWGGTVPITVQVAITDDAATITFDAASAFSNDGIVGFHNGVDNSSATSIDLSAGPNSGTGGPQIALACTQAPILGGDLLMDVSGIPAGGIGGVLIEIGTTIAGTPLPTPLFAAGCNDYLAGNGVTLGLAFNANPCVAYPFAMTIPNDPTILCLPIAAQAAAINLTAGNFVTSNGLDAVVGNL